MTAVFNTSADGEQFGGGFRFDSLLIQNALPSVGMKGGSSDVFSTYAIPFGLWVSNQNKSYTIRGGAEDAEGAEDTDTDENEKRKKDVLAQDLHEKLLELVREKRIKKSKTKKQPPMKGEKEEKEKEKKKKPKNTTKKNHD